MSDTAPDLTAEEYNEIMDALMARAESAPLGDVARILKIANSVKDKFGRHGWRRQVT